MTNQQKQIAKTLKRLLKNLPTAKGKVKTDKDAGILYITVKMPCPVRKENAVAERWLNESQCATLIKMGNPKLDLEMMLELMVIECERLIGGSLADIELDNGYKILTTDELRDGLDDFRASQIKTKEC